MNRIVRGDILRFVAHYRGPKFHALLTDPPYHLYSRRTAGEKSQSSSPFGRINKGQGGFMGKLWDGGDIAFDPETWAALGELMLPGAFGMSFASSRGWHRLAVAIEDAGMIIHPSVFLWGQGQGFPKATRIPDDRFDGHRYGLQALKPSVEPILVWQKPYQGKPVESITETGAGALNIELARITQNRHIPSSDDDVYTLDSSPYTLRSGAEPSGSLISVLYALNRIASALRYYSTDDTSPSHNADDVDDKMLSHAEYETLKDRLYPNGAWCGMDLLSILNSQFGCPSCRHLYDGLLHVVQDSAQYGAPSLADALERICEKLSEPLHSPCLNSDHLSTGDVAVLFLAFLKLLAGDLFISIIPQTRRTSIAGRWPANFVLQHSPECVRVGTKRVKGDSPNPRNRISPSMTFIDGVGGMDANAHKAPNGYADPDGLETVDDWRCVEGCPVKALGEQSGESISKGTPRNNGEFKSVAKGRDLPHTTFGHDDSGTASRFFFNADWSYEIAEQLTNADPVQYVAKASRRERDAGLESVVPQKRDPSRHDYQPSMNDGDGNPYNRGVIPVRNNHPTIKPISLCKWLATLLLPPRDYAPRRILVPFAGAGSEMIGAMLAGWDEIIGVEKEGEYVELAKARLGWWGDLVKWGHTDIDAMLHQWNTDEPDGDSDESDVDGWSQLDMFG